VFVAAEKDVQNYSGFALRSAAVRLRSERAPSPVV